MTQATPRPSHLGAEHRPDTEAALIAIETAAEALTGREGLRGRWPEDPALYEAVCHLFAAHVILSDISEEDGEEESQR